jgi:hypothetical protein
MQMMDFIRELQEIAELIQANAELERSIRNARAHKAVVLVLVLVLGIAAILWCFSQ